MQKRNYQKELEKLLDELQNPAANRGEDKPYPTLFLHSCCAPCSSYVLRYLREYFAITVFYYNPNISEKEEYEKRAAEQKRLIEVYNTQGIGVPIRIVDGEYESGRFYDFAAPLADCPEGGKRCFLCYEMRLAETAKCAAEGGYDYFCTTLSISPLKNAEKINEIGEHICEEMRKKYENPPLWLPSDFKKKDGYKQSVELSHTYGLYRQDFCGCIYSKEERRREKQGEVRKDGTCENTEKQI